MDKCDSKSQSGLGMEWGGKRKYYNAIKEKLKE